MLLLILAYITAGAVSLAGCRNAAGADTWFAALTRAITFIIAWPVVVIMLQGILLRRRESKQWEAKCEQWEAKRGQREARREQWAAEREQRWAVNGELPAVYSVSTV